MAGDAVGLVYAQHPPVHLLVDPALRLQESRCGSFVRDLLGSDVVILKGQRSPRAPRSRWGFYYQSEDPVVSPTVSEVEAADGMLILATCSTHDGIGGLAHRRFGLRASAWSAPYRVKRPRFSVQEGRGETGRTAKTDKPIGDEGEVLAAGDTQAPQARPPSLPCGASTSTSGTSPVVNLLAALQACPSNAIKVSSQLGLQLPIPPKNCDPSNCATHLPTTPISTPPLFMTSGVSSAISPASAGLPLLYNYLLRPPNKGPSNPTPLMQPANPAPTNPGTPPVLMLQHWGLRPPALCQPAPCPQQKGEIERLVGQDTPLLSLPVAPVPLFPSANSSALPVSQITPPQGANLQNVTSQVPMQVLNLLCNANTMAASPGGGKEAQGPGNIGVDPSQAAATMASLMQFLAVWSSSRQGT